MAKKGTAPGLRKALKVVDQLGGQMAGERMGDYRVGLSANAAGTQNLRAQVRGLTRDLLAGQNQQVGGLRAGARAAQANRAAVAAQQARVTNRYGAALGQSIAQSYAQARTGAQGTATTARAAVKTGKKIAGTARTVAGIAQAGVAAQHQAAKYALAQALQQRTIIDNQTLAGLTGDLYSQAMQYNMQWELWKKQQNYAARKAEEAAGAQGRAAAEALMTDGQQIALDAVDAWRLVRFDEEARNDFSVTTAAADWAARAGYDVGGPEYQLYMATLRGLTHGQTASDAFAQGARTLFSRSAGWEDWGEEVITAGMIGIRDVTAAGWETWQQAGGTFDRPEGGPPEVELGERSFFGIGRSEGSPVTISGGDELWNLDWWLHPQDYGYTEWWPF